MKLNRKQLRFRLFSSLCLGAIFAGLFTFAFLKIKNGPEDDNISVTLRRVFGWNEKISSLFYSNRHEAPPARKPPKGQAPRFNGGIGLTSAIDLLHYRVEIESSDRTLKLPLSAFQALPKAEYATLFKCIEGWSSPIDYGGVRFSDFMKAYQVGSKPDGSLYRYVGFETPDEEYYVSIDMDSMMNPQTVLAYEMNEAPLDLKNGAPLRLIIPVKYGIKNIKRIGYISFSDVRPPDYWTEQGYDWWSGL